MSKVKHNLLSVRIVLIVIAVAVIIGAPLLWATRTASGRAAVFALFDRLAVIGEYKPKFEEVHVDTVSATLDELMSDPRTVCDDSLFLINTDAMIPEGREFAVSEYADTGVLMNECIMSAYADIAAEVRERFGEKLYISSAYRTAEEQMAAAAEEGDVAQIVGASEHQAGLAVDVYVMYYAGTGFLDSDVGKWVNRHCQEYGLIVRYPYYGKSGTGIEYEPWHLRYVGLPHSKIIANGRLTFEGYLDSLEEGIFYSYDGYLICRQAADADTVELPESYSAVTVSEDNLGGYVMTFKF